jgi:hypothetical protein
MNKKEKYLLSVVAEKDCDTVYIHTNRKGLDRLSRSIDRLRKHLENNDCDHDHFFTVAWAGDELTETMLEQETNAGCRQIHHIKLYTWTDEWVKKHKL